MSALAPASPTWWKPLGRDERAWVTLGLIWCQRGHGPGSGAAVVAGMDPRSRATQPAAREPVAGLKLALAAALAQAAATPVRNGMGGLSRSWWVSWRWTPPARPGYAGPGGHGGRR